LRIQSTPADPGVGVLSEKAMLQAMVKTNNFILGMKRIPQ
jgi:hypothetical protein